MLVMLASINVVNAVMLLIVMRQLQAIVLKQRVLLYLRSVQYSAVARVLILLKNIVLNACLATLPNLVKNLPITEKAIMSMYLAQNALISMVFLKIPQSLDLGGHLLLCAKNAKFKGLRILAYNAVCIISPPVISAFLI